MKCSGKLGLLAAPSILLAFAAVVMAQNAQHPAPLVHLRNDRVEILTPHSPLLLAEPADIPLLIHFPGLNLVATSQQQRMWGTLLVHGSEQQLPVQYGPRGEAHVRITPLRLGKVELELAGVFPDGGTMLKRTTLNVEPAARRPRSLTIGDSTSPLHDNPRILMSLQRPLNSLNISVTYDNIPVRIQIDPSFAKFRMIPDGENAPVQLDRKTGSLTALHPGEALIETSFAGRRTLTCVDVEEIARTGSSYSQKQCQRLLAPGERLRP
jgi:hypothetical protein